MKLKLKKLARVLAVTAVAYSATLVGAATFRSADVHPKDYPTVLAVKYMGEELSKATGGKYKIKVFGDSALGSEKDTVEQVKIGALDMVRVNTAAVPRHRARVDDPVVPVPVPRHRALPQDDRTARTGDKILAAFEKAGFIGLVMYESGARSMYAKKPIKNLADVKGMKIRVQPSDLWVGTDQRDGRLGDADALRRGLHRPEDRPGRRRREQLPVVRDGQALRGRAGLQRDHARDGAGSGGVLEEDLGHAVARKSRRRSARRPRNRCPTT